MTPVWIDKGLYPFEPKTFDVEAKRMSYVDEGRGEPVVFVHGTPTWSFMYRKLIVGLKDTCRCIAPDNVGFGLSDKPTTFVYRPEKQAEYLESLIGHLGLKNLTLVVHDFGGPIGLSYALNHPENVKHVVLLNTWMWSLKGNSRAERIDRFVRGSLGRWVYLKLNAVPRFLMPALIRDKSGFDAKVKRHYVAPFAAADSRYGLYGYAKALLGSGDWCELERWTSVWPLAEIHRLPNTGHFVAEEHGEDILPYVDMLMHDTAFLPTATIDG
jgi:pimeloyl-ACP methyl ester carboxylesterase